MKRYENTASASCGTSYHGNPAAAAAGQTALRRPARQLPMLKPPALTPMPRPVQPKGQWDGYLDAKYDGNTYIFQNDNTAGFNGGPGGAIDARGDGVVELVGFTGELTGANLVLA